MRMWIRWLFWQDVVLPGVECWVAYLLEAGHIAVAEVMVYTRAFDDAIDALLMRSKAEAELERLKSDAKRLATLHTALVASSAGPDDSPVLKAVLSPTSKAASAASPEAYHHAGVADGVAATRLSPVSDGRVLR